MTVSLEVLQYVSCICYLVQFKENKIQVLIDSSNEINVIILAYIAKLGSTTQKISVGTQKIYGLPIDTYGIVSASLLL